MPHLLFKGIAADKLHAVCEPMAEELAALCQCGTDNFTMEIANCTVVFGAPEQETAYLFVEVAWFERGSDTRNAFAETVTRHLLKLGEADIEVAFRTYREDSYYINGLPYGDPEA
ncbi:DUF1904 family protein [Paenibacillus protaetiae]|uniref:DUF1904 family protein n=1 Tax=Paenibacillus protaetiae TaxID=2509456 RepID=A0A4P6EWX7_9BACL|nr:DUF1904 family protein [Paenibacillus protaetiae]QAY66723.1 DUF1904 family protein [Paenibacillus protaetiae]